MKQYGEAIQLDNLNNSENNLDTYEINKLNNFSPLNDKLNKLKTELTRLKNGETIEGTNLRKKMYEINELEAYRKYLSGLRKIVDNKKNGEKFAAVEVSKYDLANYKLEDFKGTNWGIAMEYKDISSLNIGKKEFLEKNGHKIEGYIHYISVVDGIFVDKNLVVFDNEIYNIKDNGELILDKGFKLIDGIKIKELREGTVEKIENTDYIKDNYTDFKNGEIVDSEIESELKELKSELDDKLQDAKTYAIDMSERISETAFSETQKNNKTLKENYLKVLKEEYKGKTTEELKLISKSLTALFDEWQDNESDTEKAIKFYTINSFTETIIKEREKEIKENSKKNLEK